MGNSSTKVFNNNRRGLSDEGYDLYKMYCAIKAHFTGSGKFDYSKSGASTSAKRSSYISRSDAPMFARVAKRTDDPEGLLIANMVADPKFWVGDLESEEAYATYNDWKRRTSQIEYYFKTDLEKLKDDFTSNFVFSANGDLPYVVDAVLEDEINFETFTILVHLLALNKAWSKNLETDYLAPKIVDRAVRYHPLIRYDKKSLASLIRGRWEQH